MLKYLIVFSIIAVCTANKSYENYKVYKVQPTTEVQVQRIIDLKKDTNYDFWTDTVTIDQDVRIMVSPEKETEFVKYVGDVGINASIAVANVQELINAQLTPASTTRSSSLGSFDWIQYHGLDEIHAWLDELPSLYPGVVTTVNIGTTYQGRSIKAVVIDFKAGSREGTPLVGVIEGGIHAREWISPATVTWIIKEFLTSSDPDVRFMAEHFIWHIIPVLNPDGYFYTFDGDRMWRKNRNPDNFVATCSSYDLGNGIDLNRNFNFLWMTTGASDNPCTQTYAGPIPASEYETQALTNYVTNIKNTGNLLYYFAFHSYSQMILIPHSHLGGADVIQVSNYGDLYEIAIRGASKLTEVHGIPYQVGTSADILYEVSGSSFDWAKGVLEVPISYLFELRDVGPFGFLLPPTQIIPNNEEIMACLVEMDKATRDLRYYSGSSSVVASALALVVSVGFLMITQ